MASQLALKITKHNANYVQICRFILGIGVGGVYPLAATVAAESSGKNNRGKQVSFVFSMQGCISYI